MMVKAIGVEKIMFEAPEKSQQTYLILHFGTDVNLGNIRTDDVIPLETLRCGIRGDTFGRCRVCIGKEGAGSILPGEMPVVIDALRASSTIATALACGVEEIIPVTRDEDAFRPAAAGHCHSRESGGCEAAGL